MAFDLNAALAQYDYRNSTPMPGETATSFYERKNQEYLAGVQQSNALARSIKDMQAQQQQQQQYEAALQAHGLWTPQQTEAEQDAKLERERQLAFGALNDQKGFYDRGTAAELEQSLLGQMRGSDSPFSPQVVSGLVGRETDAEAAQLRAEQNMIRSRMANSGLGGSGLATSAMVDAQRAASKRSRAASRDIRTRAELENFQARERARSQAQSFVAQEAANRASAIKQEVGLRSRFQVVGDDQGRDKLAQALSGGAQAQQSPMLPIQRSGRITGNQPKAQYGGVTWLGQGQNVGQFSQSGAGPSTGYQNFGLGGSAGPWGAVARSHQIADRNMARTGNGYSGGGIMSQAIQNQGPSFSAPQPGTYRGPVSNYEQSMSNPFAPKAGSRGEWMLRDSYARRGII